MGNVVTLLTRPTYGLSQAAGLLGIPTASVRRWLDGYVHADTVYPPVVRPEHTGDKIVTWGEFVELGYLREYRRANVSLQQLRTVIELLRVEFGTLYPLAVAAPLVSEQELVLEIQERVGLPKKLAFVVRTGQTIAIADNAWRFFKKIEFLPGGLGEASKIRPAGHTSPVLIDPRVSFGEPSVGGVATERLWELFDAGEPIADLVKGYEIEEADIRAGIAYEEQFRSF